MAEHLLKGGKMLAKTCPECGTPLFEIKGETLCVVCREAAEEQENKESQDQAVTPEEPVLSRKTHPPAHKVLDMPLQDQFSRTIRTLLSRMEEETNTHTLQEMAETIRSLTESYALVNQE